MSIAFEAAAVGHRITHEGDLDEPRHIETEATLELISTGQTSPAKLGLGIARSPQRIRVMTRTPEQKRVQGERPGETPDPTGTIGRGSLDVFIGPQRQPAAIVNPDYVVPCDKHSDGPLLTGAANVMVNGVPWSRRFDQVDCGAFVGEGEPSILIGGAPSEKPRPISTFPDERTVTTVAVAQARVKETFVHAPTYGRVLSRPVEASQRIVDDVSRHAAASSSVDVGRQLLRPNSSAQTTLQQALRR